MSAPFDYPQVAAVIGGLSASFTLKFSKTYEMKQRRQIARRAIIGCPSPSLTLKFSMINRGCKNGVAARQGHGKARQGQKVERGQNFKFNFIT